MGLFYIWLTHSCKWFCALLTHWLESLIDCGSWLTLERRKPVSLNFSFTLGSLSFTPPRAKHHLFLSSDKVKRVMFSLTGETQVESSTWPHLQHKNPSTLWCFQRVPRCFMSILMHYDKWLKIAKQRFLESLYSLEPNNMWFSPVAFTTAPFYHLKSYGLHMRQHQLKVEGLLHELI